MTTELLLAIVAAALAVPMLLGVVAAARCARAPVRARAFSAAR